MNRVHLGIIKARNICMESLTSPENIHAHVRTLVHTSQFLCPFALMFDIDTMIVENATFLSHTKWFPLPLTMFAVYTAVFFYQGRVRKSGRVWMSLLVNGWALVPTNVHLPNVYLFL